MKNRLTIARKLLKKDGVLYIHIDEKEIGYLTTLTDEIFDRSNYLNTIVVKTSDPSGHKVVNPSPYSQTEFVLMYAKNKQAYKYDIQYVETNYDPMYNKLVLNIDDDFSNWQFSTVSDEIVKINGLQTVKEAKDKFGAEKFFKLMAEFALKNKNRVFQATAISNKAGKDIVSLREQSKLERDIVFHYPREGYEDIYILNGRQMYFYSSKVKVIYGKEAPAKPLTNLWSDIPYNGIASEGNVSMKNGKKPEKLLQRIIEISTNKNDIVMDFFAGSGTTAAIAHKINRRYIAIEQLDYIEDLPLERLQNVIGKTVKPEGELHEKIEFDQSGISKAVNWKGGGSFVYCELMQYNQKYIDQIMQADNTETLLTIWEDMRENAFLNYLFNNKSFDKNIEDFKQLELEEQKKFLFELLDKNQLYLNYGEMEDENFTISETDKKLNNQFYKTR